MREGWGGVVIVVSKEYSTYFNICFVIGKRLKPACMVQNKEVSKYTSSRQCRRLKPHTVLEHLRIASSKYYEHIFSRAVKTKQKLYLKTMKKKGIAQTILFIAQRLRMAER